MVSKAAVVKDSVFAVAAVIGGTVSGFLGGFDKAMQTLLVFMLVDFITGILIAAVWKKSPKTSCGSIESKAAGKGLIRKFMYLVMVLVAVQIDSVLGLGDLTRNAAIFGFVGVEGMSIVENMGIMGVPLPKQLTKAFELLKEKGEEGDGPSCST